MGKLPTQCKGAVQINHGTIESSIEIREIPIDFPENDEVLVRVRAASLNPLNYQTIHDTQMTLPRNAIPHTIGADISGDIVALGDDVKEFQIGDEVIASAYSQILSSSCDGCAEYVVLSSQAIVPKPPNLSHVEAATLPTAGQAAYHALVMDVQLQPRDRVLVLGGSCATGMMIIQIASAIGASFIVTTSTQHEQCMRLGANQIIDHTNENVWDVLNARDEFDLIIDCVGGNEAWEKGQKILKKTGTFVTLVGDNSFDSDYSPTGLLQATKSKIGRDFWHAWGSHGKYHKLDWFQCEGNEALVAVSEYAANGFLRPIVDGDVTYALEQVVEVLQKIEGHDVHGRLVIEL